MTKFTSIAILAASLLLIACQQESADQTTDSGTNPTTETAGAPGSEPSGETDEVEFEPAYPAEVSTEGLSDEDIAQQESAVHSHDAAGSHDEGHTHDKGHSHEGGEPHSHGEEPGHDEDPEHGEHDH